MIKVSSQNYNFVILDQKLLKSCVVFSNSSFYKELNGDREKQIKYRWHEFFDAFNAIIENRARFCNTSICLYGKSHYILSVRILYTNDKNTKIIPGNNFQSKFEKGSNFWWIDWSNENFKSTTIFFMSNKKFNNILMLRPYCMPLDVEIFKHDVRLMNSDNKLLIYNPTFRVFSYEFGIHKIDNDICISVDISTKLYSCELGNNFAVSWILNGGKNNSYFYLDWFYEKGICYKICKYDLFGKIIEKYYEISPDNVIIGEGSYIDQDNCMKDKINYGVTPLMSFGTPNIACNINGKKINIGIGHSKIYNDKNYKYKKKSNINVFRKNTQKIFKEKYGEKFINHDAYNSQQNIFKGYIYTFYFYYYVTDDDNNIIDFKISDSFLPIDINYDYEYVFSLFFPTGIIQNENIIYITGGYGDYNSCYLNINIDNLLDLCRHDINIIDMNKYDYKIMVFDNGNIYFSSVLPNQKGGSYHLNYMKNKKKYVETKKKLLK
jgi:hypothetical protein